MINYQEFGTLRLASFRPDAEIVELDDWEYEDRLWVGEAVGFSEWLRPAEEPEILCCLSINLTEFPLTATNQVLQAIDLPVRSGMSFEELRAILGEPVKTLKFVPEQNTYEFLTAEPYPYKVSCTVPLEGGLSYLEVMVPLPEPPDQSD